MVAVDDLKSVVTAHMVTGKTYDDDTGTYTTTTTSDANIDALLFDFEGAEILSTVNYQTDQQVMVETRLLKNATSPSYFVIDDVKWDVVRPLRILGDSVRLLHIRNTGEAA